MSRRCILTVAFGNRLDTGRPHEENIVGTSFPAKIPRWEASFEKYSPAVDRIIWNDQLPPNSIPHDVRPYSFKVAAIRDAIKRGYDQILWADVSAIAVNDLSPMWNLLEWQGYWMSDNGILGEYCSDAALRVFGMTREQAMGIREACTTAFAINFNSPEVKGLVGRLSRWANTDVFFGPATNERGQISSDPRVKGHRWDQTAVSAAAYYEKMVLQPHHMAWRDVDGYEFFRDRGLFEVHR